MRAKEGTKQLIWNHAGNAVDVMENVGHDVVRLTFVFTYEIMPCRVI